MKLYLVHRGFAQEDEQSRPEPLDPVTYRLSRADAESVAEFLNAKLHEMRFYVWLASQTNHGYTGNAEKIEESVNSESWAKFDALREKALRELPDQVRLNQYTVTEMSVSGENEARLKKELESITADK